MSGHSNSTVSIRQGTRADLALVGRLGAVLVGVHHDFDQERFIPATPTTAEGYASYLGSQLGKRNVVILVAEQSATIVGYAYASVDGYDWMSLRGPAGVLHDIVVDPEYRGQGIGRLLLDAAVRELTERGAPRVVLSTAERNHLAQGLFASAGFRRTMIEMTRELGPADEG